MRDLFFVSCTAGVKEQTPLYRSLEKLALRDYRFHEHNRRGLPDWYNEHLDELAGSDRILVLAHSDVTIADVFVREKLDEAVKTFNIAGLVGSSVFDFQVQTPNYSWPIWPRECLSGAVEQVMADGTTDWARFGPTPRRCVALDGLLLAIDPRAIGGIRFDPRFAFHLYDLDFCLTAHLAGLVLGTTNVYAQHASIGDFEGEAYQRAMREFRAKWTAAAAERQERM